MDIFDYLPQGGAWTIWGLFFVLVFGAPAVLSEEGAKKLWLIKRMAAWVHTREERSVQKEIQYNTLQAKSFNDRLSIMEQDHKKDLARLNERFSNLENDFKKEKERWNDIKLNLERELEESIDYRDYLIRYLRKIRLSAIENNWVPPLDEFYTLEEWRMRKQANLRKPPTTE